MWTSPATADAPVTLQSVVTFKKVSAIASLTVPSSVAAGGGSGAVTQATAAVTGKSTVSTQGTALSSVPTTAVGVIADEDGNVPQVNAANVANDAAAKPVTVNVEAGNITIIAALAGCLVVVAIVFALSFVKMTRVTRNATATSSIQQQANLSGMIEVPSSGTTPEPVSPLSVV